jgi:hypothetical protein
LTILIAAKLFEMTKREKLQAIVDEALSKNDSLHQFWVEYRPFQGWYAVCEPRWFGDDGEYLGANYSQAKRGLRHLGL